MLGVGYTCPVAGMLVLQRFKMIHTRHTDMYILKLKNGTNEFATQFKNCNFSNPIEAVSVLLGPSP